MAFAVKFDFCGLVEATKQNNVAALLIRDHAINGSNEEYAPNGQNDDIIGIDIYGGDSAPTNSYGLKMKIACVAGAIKLNSIVERTDGTGQSAVTKKYGLENVKIVCKGGSPVAISATAQELEDTATAANQGYYWIPAFAVDTKYEAQDIFGAFTMGGEGCHLTETTADIACKIKKDDVAGVKVSSDCGSGLITVSGTILSTAGNEPTITPKAEAVSLGNEMTSNWVLTKSPKPTESNPEKAAKQFTFELKLPLKKFRIHDESSSSSSAA